MPQTSRARSHGARTLIALAVGALLVLGAAQPASADSYGLGDGYSGRLPDDAIEDFCFSPEFWANTYLVESALYAMQNLDRQTGMEIRHRSQCTSTTDIVFTVASGPGARGSFTCTNSPGWYTCNSGVLRVNVDAIREGLAWGDPDRWLHQNVAKTLCHEVGQAVGLEHGKGKWDCMESGDVSGWSWEESTEYNRHHLDHIASMAVAWS